MLTKEQLESVKLTGEFEVTIHFTIVNLKNTTYLSSDNVTHFT